MFKTGSQIRFYNNIRILDELGEGGCGLVYKVFSEELNKECVLKVLHHEKLSEAGLSEKNKEKLLRREANRLSEIRSKHVPRFLGFYSSIDEAGHVGVGFLQELIRGTSIRLLLKGGKRFQLEEAIDILVVVLEVLVELHESKDENGKPSPILHRDINPNNIMLSEDGRLYLIDFGLSVQVKKTGIESSLSLSSAGTPGYTGPEQARGLPERASDIYSLGITFLELCSGYSPSDICNGLQRRSFFRDWEDCPLGEEFQRLLVEMTEYNSVDRLTDAREILTRLSGVGVLRAESSAISKDRLPVETRQIRIAEVDSLMNVSRKGFVHSLDSDLVAYQKEKAKRRGGNWSVFGVLSFALGLPVKFLSLLGMALGLRATAKKPGVRRQLQEARDWGEKENEPLHRAEPRGVSRIEVVGEPDVREVSTPERPKAGELIDVPELPGAKAVYIPSGTFMMGSPESDSEAHMFEKPEHPVHISRGFWMLQTPVAQSQYEAVMGVNPSSFKGDELPVESVSWHEAALFANKLSVKSGVGEGKLCFKCSGTGKSAVCIGLLGRSYVSCKGWRLPTEAEWEYAARAGTRGARYGKLDAVAWYRGNSGSKTHPVGLKEANGWGLYDMLGNVWEWNYDYYDENWYKRSLGAVAGSGGTVLDPVGPSSGAYRVLRGGSWDSFARNARSAYRGRLRPADRYSVVGFRLVRVE